MAAPPISDLARGCELHADLRGGGRDRVYAGGDAVYTEVDAFEGFWHIRPPGGYCDAHEVSFRASVPLDAVLLCPKCWGASGGPRWATRNGWGEGVGCVVSTAGAFTVMRRRVEAGERVSLRGRCRGAGFCHMFTVLFREAAGGRPDEAGAASAPGQASDSGKPGETRAAPSAAGEPVGTGPWRLTLSQEGSSGSLWRADAVRRHLAEGYASWSAGERVLDWRPRYHRGAGGKWSNWDGNPSGTVWRMVPRSSLREGVRLLFRMRSRKEPGLPRVDYSERWTPEEMADNLRTTGGTGDFRVGLLQTGGAADMGQWQAYQVRLYPYLHREAKKHIGANDSSNCSHWYRSKPGGRDCLMDDWAQTGDRDGFSKLKHRGELKFGMGPHSPFDEWFEIEVRLRLDEKGRVCPWVRVHDDAVELDPYEHRTKGFRGGFEEVDAVCFSFNNMRPYCDVRLQCAWE